MIIEYCAGGEKKKGNRKSTSCVVSKGKDKKAGALGEGKRNVLREYAAGALAERK